MLTNIFEAAAVDNGVNDNNKEWLYAAIKLIKCNSAIQMIRCLRWVIKLLKERSLRILKASVQI